ncbi:hypothetical protein IT417_03115 [bacterium]|nr:hypothetical protein [bacterium]
MLRGLVQLSKSQVLQLFASLNQSLLGDTPLWAKMQAAVSQTNDLVSVELSEDEIETLLDQLDASYNDVRQVLSDAVLSWRS